MRLIMRLFVVITCATLPGQIADGGERSSTSFIGEDLAGWDGLIAEHWESVDWVRVYQSFGLLPDDVRDA